MLDFVWLILPSGKLTLWDFWIQISLLKHANIGEITLSETQLIPSCLKKKEKQTIFVRRIFNSNKLQKTEQKEGFLNSDLSDWLNEENLTNGLV